MLCLCATQIKILISNWPRTWKFSKLGYYRQGRQLLLTFLTMVTRWSLSRSNSLWTGLWLGGELGRGKSEKACRQTFGTAVPRHPLCIRSWCKFLLARTLTVERSDWHRRFGRHVARVLITKWNNKTLQRLLSLFKSYYKERNYELQSRDSHYL